mmetsp:Transcript_25884/g.65013  ORF Transcript_25884/g.65013 Transcript_25884/m.65013 type:complete len:415 (+) Transcript_25884:144-1388(+)
MADNKGTVLPGSTDFEKLEYLCQRTYKAQAVWFLNAFWDSFGEGEAENLWNYVHKAVEIDLDHREAGTHLNEMEAHRLLESFDETMTVREMRTYLRQHGAIGERVKNVPLVHWWIAKYKVDWAKMVNASQGDNREAIEKAQAMLESAQAALNEATARANEAATALREAIASESAAKTAEEQAHARAEAAKASEEAAHTRKEELAAKEIELEAAQAELEAALAELKAQEDAYNAKTAELTKKSEEGGVVSRNRAKNELAQHLAEDPLPLRRAKITMEAAVKKADRARNAVATARVDAEAAAEQASKDRAAAEQAAAEASAARQAAEQARAEATAARQSAEQARAAAEQARAHSEQAKAAADAARQEAERQVAAAEAFLQEEKAKPGQAYGALWWIERELFEAKKYMPTSKGGIAK